MLREFWNLIKSFKKRFALYCLVVLAMNLFGSIPFLIAKLGAFVIFVAASAFFLPVAASQFASTIRQLVVHRNRVRLPVSAEISDLSRRAGVEIKEIGIIRVRNAYVLGKSLVLGTELIEGLSLNERQAVVAHELGHIKRRHAFVRSFCVLAFLPVLLFSWSKLYSPVFLSESITQIILTIMVNISGLAFLLMATIPVNWYVEHDADRFAAKSVGKEHIRSALLKLADAKNLEEPSETHPSIAERIRRIDKLG